VADFGKTALAVSQVFSGRRLSVMLLGDVTQQVAGKVTELVVSTKAQLILEEGAGYSKSHADLRSVASESIPLSGFVYTADVYLSRDI
jgi:hypothetical protein